MRVRVAVCAAVLAVLCTATESRALFGRDDIVYPLRYKVRGVARFVGRRVSGDYFREEHTVHARKLEVDVLSIDGPDTFHWEKPLADGTFLDGVYAEDGQGRLEMHAFTSSHRALDGAQFPFDRPNGVVRMNADELQIRPDLAKIHGRNFHQISRPDLDHLRGRAAFRFRGKRILSGSD